MHAATEPAFPRMLRCTQRLAQAALDPATIPAVVAAECQRIGLPARMAGKTVAIGCSSRGIANYGAIVIALVDVIRRAGGSPFLFPAMGSHGGGTPEGQVEVLAGHGLTEATAGCPIRSSMAVVQLGTTPQGLPVYLDRHAASADAIIVVNRIKAHTNFRAPVESGLCKMLAIGCGKQAQAFAIHNFGVRGLTDHMPEVARALLARAPVIAGLGIVEDGHHATSRIAALLPEQFETHEAELLREAKRMTPRLPVDELDLLIVERIGKDVSGTGMDTNVVGRCRLLDFAAFPEPRIKVIIGLGLTAGTHGNAIGMGLCDLITRRLADAIDPQSTYVNVITGQCPQLGAMPVVCPTDREAIRTALDHFLGPQARERAHIARIRDTLDLGTFQVSAPLAERLRGRDGLTVATDGEAMAFDADGALR